MDNLLEILVPLIFAAVYFFGNLLSGKSEDEGTGPPKLPHQPGGHGEAEDYAERQRQIQEAIRRKIMQRRQAAAETQEVPAPEAPVITRREPHKQVREQHKEVQQRNVPQVEPTPAPVVTPDEPSGAFSWDASDNVYEHQMQERLQQIEAAKRRAEVLRRQADLQKTATSAPRSAAAERGRRPRGGLLSGPVRKVLRDPAAARVGFIYGEVLGKPVSLRPSGSGVAN
jgi:hypothetical protein